MGERLPYSAWAPGRASKKRGNLSTVWKDELGVGRCGKELGVGLGPLKGVAGEEEST